MEEARGEGCGAAREPANDGAAQALTRRKHIPRTHRNNTLRKHAATIKPAHLADEAVGARERRVDREADADEPAGHRVLQRVRLGEEADDAAVDRLALDAPLGVLLDDAGAHLDLLAEAQHALQDRAAGDAALELVDLGAGLVHVEGAGSLW